MNAITYIIGLPLLAVLGIVILWLSKNPPTAQLQKEDPRERLPRTPPPRSRAAASLYVHSAIDTALDRRRMAESVLPHGNGQVLTHTVEESFMRMCDAFEAELASLRNKGLLQDIKPRSLPTQIVRPRDKKALSIFVVSCCDGHQSGDTYRHVVDTCGQLKLTLGNEAEEEDCFHWKTCNGGPLVLSVPEMQTQNYKGHTLHLDQQLFACFEESRRLKGMDAVLLIGHAKCGKADPHLKTLSEYYERLTAAKKRFMEEFGLTTQQVIAWLQTHRKSGKRRAYHSEYSYIRLP